MLSECVDIELSDFEAKHMMLTVDYMLQAGEILIGGVPNVLEVHFMCLFMSLSRILVQGSISTNQFYPMRNQVDIQTVEVII